MDDSGFSRGIPGIGEPNAGRRKFGNVYLILKFQRLTERKYSRNMASDKEFLKFILEKLSGLDDVSYRPMMGEYIIYYRGKIVGGVYDDRLLVKPVKAAVSRMRKAVYELPYEGAKEMLLVEDVDNKEFLTELFRAMYGELPTPRRKGGLAPISGDGQK